MHTIVFTPLLINTHTQTTLTKTHSEVKKSFPQHRSGRQKNSTFYFFLIITFLCFSCFMSCQNCLQTCHTLPLISSLYMIFLWVCMYKNTWYVSNNLIKLFFLCLVVFGTKLWTSCNNLKTYFFFFTLKYFFSWCILKSENIPRSSFYILLQSGNMKEKGRAKVAFCNKGSVLCSLSMQIKYSEYLFMSFL